MKNVIFQNFQIFNDFKCFIPFHRLSNRSQFFAKISRIVTAVSVFFARSYSEVLVSEPRNHIDHCYPNMDVDDSVFTIATNAQASISGHPFVGQTLRSSMDAEWRINRKPTGEKGTTFQVPFSANSGDLISNGYGDVTVDKWPDSLVAYWDFSEGSPPYIAKKGIAKFLLVNGARSTVTTANEGPFGKSASFDGVTDFLIIPSASVGELNLSQFGNQCTVIAWVKRESDRPGFIGGMWQEDDNDPRRQYGLFVDLPVYGGDDRVCGHISKTGGPTKGYKYSRDYSSTRRFIRNTGEYRCIAMTYDGNKIISYLDGVPDSYTGFKDETGNVHDKNPYTFKEGLNNKTVSDFTVGAVKLTGGYSNWFHGKIGGLAVFKKALTNEQIMWIHLNANGADPHVLKFDYFSLSIHEGTESYATTFGWNSFRGASAKSTSGINAAQNFESIVLNGKHFLFRAGSDAGTVNVKTPAMTYFDHIKGIDFNLFNDSKHNVARFSLNNSRAADLVRFCIKIDGKWYASNATYGVPTDGRTGVDWSNAVTHEVPLTLAPNTWMDLTIEPEVSLRLGKLITNQIASGELQGVGFFSPNLSDVSSIVRIDRLELIRAVSR